MFPNKTKLLQVLKIIIELYFFIFLVAVLLNVSFIGGQSAADFSLNGIIISFISGLDILRSKLTSFFFFYKFLYGIT